MLRKEKNLTKSRAEYSVGYTDFSGVDLTGDESGISPNRLAYSENLYRDYDGDGAGILETFPGFRTIRSFGAKIRQIAGFVGSDGKSYLVVHAGTDVYRFDLADRDKPENLTPVASAADRKSRSYLSGGALYLLDGERLLRITESEAKHVGSGAGEEPPYVPVTYRNETEYEQRNLLSRSFSEVFDLTDAEYYSYGTEGLTYRILDPAARECALIGLPEGFSGELFVPSAVIIGKDRFTVAEIADSCFAGCIALTKITAANGIRRIGAQAFSGCTSLTEAVFPDSVAEIGYGAFNNCTSLSYLRVGKGLSRIGNSAISFCTALTAFRYGGTPSAFEKVEGRSVLGSTEILCNIAAKSLKIALPIHSPCESVQKVTVGATRKAFASERRGSTSVTAVILTFSDRKEIDGKTVSIEGTLENAKNTGKTANGFLPANPALTGDPKEAVLGCTVAESFDGRVFLSGNPAYPNTVFYTARGRSGKNDPTFFGEYNYFSDGIGPFPVCALLSVGTSLAVFKQADDGGGSIFYHIPKETGIDLIPKIYPVSYVHSGIECFGEAVCFSDDPVFLSKSGLCSLAKPNISTERSVVARSHNVNYSLLSKDLKNASLVQWGGYLAVGCGSEVFLADSRSVFRHATGSLEYEWFFLSGFGTYRGDYATYRYASNVTVPGSEVDEEKQGLRVPAKTPVYRDLPTGDQLCYVREDGKKIAVEMTDEMQGGVFSPACAFFSFEGLLLFGTESGDLCLVNTDLRGVPPKSLAEEEGFDPAAYAAVMGRRIHPSFYQNAGHAQRVAFRTKKDDCGIPHLEKSTVNHSLVLKLRSFSSGVFRCEVGTDRSGYSELGVIPSASLGFDDLDFSRVSLSADDSATVVLSERERRWVEKQIAVSTDEFCSPIGIYSICYRFTVAGRIRK